MDCVSKDKCQIRKRRRRRSTMTTTTTTTIDEMAKSKRKFDAATLIKLGDTDCSPRTQISNRIPAQHKRQAQHDLMQPNRNFLVKEAPNCNSSSLIKMTPTSNKLSRNLCLLVLIITTSTYLQLTHCQRSASTNQEAPQQLPPSLIPQANGPQPNGRQQFPADGQPPELVKPAGQAYSMDQLVNFLNTYAASQQIPPGNLGGGGPNIRRQVPLSGRGVQPGGQLGAQQQSTPVSTPINPYNQQQQQFNQNSINNRRISFPNQPQQLFVASSPPTPYLTLNRISQLANSAQQQQQQQQQQNRAQHVQFNAPPNQLQPINTIPLGSINSNNIGGGRANSPSQMPMMPPPRGMQPQRTPQNGGQQVVGGSMMQRIPGPANAMPALGQQSTPMKSTLAGFAPSGPPPTSMTNANNAIVMVQSPSNGAMNQQQQVFTIKPQDVLATNSNLNRSDEKQRAATDAPATPTEATAGAGAEDASNESGNGDNRDTTSSTTSKSSDTAAQPTVQQQQSSSPAPATVDLDKAANDERPSGGVRPQDASWNPVESNRSAPAAGGGSLTNAAEQLLKNRINLAPSPDIVTVPPDYNPDNPNSQLPQNYDISVSAQMGGAPGSQQRPAPDESASASSNMNGNDGSSNSTNAISSSSAISGKQSGEISATTADLSSTTVAPPTIAPTAVTTVIWTPPSDTLAASSSSTAGPAIMPSRASEMRPVMNTRIRDNSLLAQNDDPAAAASPSSNNLDGVVYGKAKTRDSKPTPPVALAPTPAGGQAAIIESSVPSAGRPYIQPVQIDNQVRPFPAAGPQQPQQQREALLKSNHGGHSASFGRPSRPMSGQSSPMHVGSGFTISASGNQSMPTGDIQDYVAAQPPLVIASNQAAAASGSGSHSSAGSTFQAPGDHNGEPTISAHGGQDPAGFDAAASGGSEPSPAQSSRASQNSSSGAESARDPAQQVSAAPVSSSPAPKIRRPTFKPKPAVPPIRIDSCIVDDDSSCDQSHNERCVTEYGISSCHCKPGYARLSQLRGYCSPISALQLSMKIDRLSDDRRLVFNHTLENPNSEEYQYLEFEAIQALAGAFGQTALAKQFMGARVNKFFERKGKVWTNMSINFDLNNVTKTEKIQNLAGQELLKVTQAARTKPLGDSTIVSDGAKESVSRLADINECAARDLNDCSKYAACTNEFGGFQCQCLAGYEDKYAAADDRSKHGRVCMGCTASYCSNRGECSIVEGQKQCKCRPNFVGARCDYDTEVLAVAVGGSIIGIIILIITCWCLYIFNRRWKREQQKMDAMSATSGLTYNYVNSASTNSLMSPTRMIGGLHRSGGHQVGAMAANYGQRFGSALANGTRGAAGQHYAPDQQAIIGSASSGSSAASQPIACNPYTSNGGYQQYEDAGLLIAPASTGSSEQTSPTSNSYRGIMGAANNSMLSAQMAGNAYTLSGHHHHHHHHMQQQQHHPHHMHHMHAAAAKHQLTQFNPAADYRTLNASGTMHCAAPVAGAYESRWRTLQQDHNKQSALVGYYLSPDMLVGQQANMQQLYASPQRELCIDTGGQVGNNKARKQQGRSGANGQTLRSRSQSQVNVNLPRNSMYHNNNSEHFHEH